MKMNNILIGATLIAAIGVLSMTSYTEAQQTIAPGPSVLTMEQAEILSHMSIVFLDDGLGGMRKTIRIDGVNLQLVNGLGASNGNPGAPFLTGNTSDTEANGLGNLLIGYDEPSATNGVKTGSHNVVVGGFHTYTQDGIASVVGGTANKTDHYGNFVMGFLNDADGAASSILGGDGNTTFAAFSCIGGGLGNTTFPNATWGTVGGGGNRNVTGDSDWQAGGLFQDQ